MEQSQKNNKDFFYVISLLLVVIVLMSLGSMYWEKDNAQEKKQNIILDSDKKVLTDQEITDLVDGPYEQTDEDRLVFNVSQNTNGPKMTKVIIAPQKVSRGQEQYLEIWIKDEQGVKSVQTETELDNGFVKTLDMELFEGNIKDGKWRVKWIVENTHDTIYTTKFTAISIDGRTSDDMFNWVDPCSPGIGTPPTNDPQPTGDWYPSNGDVCDFPGGVVGPDWGNIILIFGVSFTINPGTTVAFNSGNSITLLEGAEINLAVGAVIQKGYLYVADYDGDGQAVGGTGLPGLTIVASTAPTTHPVTGRQGISVAGNWKTRLSAMRSTIQGDCYEADTDGGRDTFAGQTQFFSVNNGNLATTTLGKWDYNCNGTNDGGLADDNNGPKYSANLFNDFAWYTNDTVPTECRTYTLFGPDSEGGGCGQHFMAGKECTGITQNSSEKFISFLQKHFFSVLLHPVLALNTFDEGFFKGTSCDGQCVGDMYLYCN